MNALFLTPPTSADGWLSLKTTSERESFGLTIKEYNSLLDIAKSNVSLFPITIIPNASFINSILDLSNSFYRKYMKIHERVWQPIPTHTTPLTKATLCVCGLPFISVLKPGRALVQIDFYDIKKTQIPCIIINRTKHIHTWGWFPKLKLHNTLEQHVDALAFELCNPKCSKHKIEWAQKNGGLELWKSSNIELLTQNLEANIIIQDLTKYC
jgi:hypothetical protein